MARLDLSKKTIHAKIVYYGPGLCGKTTNLEQLNHALSNGGELMSLATHGDRTVFFDLLPMAREQRIGELVTALKLYTVPGQVRYNQTRKMVLKNVDGVVFVADSQRNLLESNRDSFDNLFENLEELGIAADDLPIVLQYNKRDLADVLTRQDLDAALNKNGYAVFMASAITGEGVFETFNAIRNLVTDQLRQAFGDLAGMAAESPMVMRRDAGAVSFAEAAGSVGTAPSAPSNESTPFVDLAQSIRAVADGPRDLGTEGAVRIRVPDLERLPAEQAQGEIRFAEMTSELASLVTRYEGMLASVAPLKRELLAAFKDHEARILGRLEDVDRRQQSSAEELRAALTPAALHRRDRAWSTWLAETVIAHAAEIKALVEASDLDRQAILDSCQRLTLAAAEILGQGGSARPAETLVGMGEMATVRLADQRQGDKEQGVDDRQRANAARVARVMVADLYLYHRDEVIHGIRIGDFQDRCRGVLRDMRATYEARVSEDVRREKDYLQLALEDLAAKVKLE